MSISVNSETKKHQPSTGIGVMSGTSLDGVDLAICSFSPDGGFEVHHFEAIDYPVKWQEKLAKAHLLSGLELIALEREYSDWLAHLLSDLVHNSPLSISFISCHGHTVFHRPDQGITYQMLNGALIARHTGLPTVCDFRRGDVAEGGQGAPLVPIGDAHLFGAYAACLNLGGFANLSYPSGSRRIAWDIGPANILLNYLAQRVGKNYDADGALAATGEIITETFEHLNALPYYKLPPPKSLGREWLESEVLPLMQNGNTADLLATAVAHIAGRVSDALNAVSGNGEILVTGGGAHNGFLIKEIRKNSRHSIVVPERKIVDGKEAIVFAYLGYLRMLGKINILASATGATSDSVGGCIYI